MGKIISAGKEFFSGLYSCFVAFIFLISSVFGFLEIIPKPEIKTAEFSFQLTYEMDGERKTIDGVYVCEFDGIDRSFEGASRQWTGYIKDHDDSTCYLLKTTNKCDIKVELDFAPDYFMSDPDFIDSYEIIPEPYIYITSGDPAIEDPANELFFELYDGDDIKIISFEYDDPIENNYGYFYIF